MIGYATMEIEIILKGEKDNKKFYLFLLWNVHAVRVRVDQLSIQSPI